MMAAAISDVKRLAGTVFEEVADCGADTIIILIKMLTDD